MGEEGFTSRQKGDLYWRKRILYIKSASVRGGHHEGYLNRDTAEDTLSCYEKAETNVQPFLTGRELVICPPTAAGQWLFSDSVASLIRIRDMIRDTDTTEPKGDNDEFEDLVPQAAILCSRQADDIVVKLLYSSANDPAVLSGLFKALYEEIDKEGLLDANLTFVTSVDSIESMVQKMAGPAAKPVGMMVNGML